MRIEYAVGESVVNVDVVPKSYADELKRGKEIAEAALAVELSDWCERSGTFFVVSPENQPHITMELVFCHDCNAMRYAIAEAELAESEVLK